MYKTYPVVSSIHEKTHKKYLSNYYVAAFRSVFPVVSQHLKASDKKGRNLGYLQPAQPLEKPRFAAHNGSCGSRLQARSRTKGKPNYLLQEARNEEALARLDMNLWCTCGRGALGVRFMGENWGGNVRQSQFPARGHNPPLTPVTAHIYANVNLSKQKHCCVLISLIWCWSKIVD